MGDSNILLVFIKYIFDMFMRALLEETDSEIYDMKSV